MSITPYETLAIAPKSQEVSILRTSQIQKENAQQTQIAGTVQQQTQQKTTRTEKMAKNTAIKMIQKGKLSLKEIAEYIPSLSMEKLKVNINEKNPEDVYFEASKASKMLVYIFGFCFFITGLGMLLTVLAEI